MNFESIINMAKGAKKAEKGEKPEKSQSELRASLETKFKSLKPSLQEGIKEYEQALKDDVFEDQEGEVEGAGEARKEALQKKLSALFDRAEKMKDKLDSKELLSQVTPEISTTYTRPDGKAETISMNIEQKLQDFLSFYQKTNIDLPTDFEQTILDIWDKNQTEIEQAIEQNGFDDMLIVPGDIPLPELADKLKMESGNWTSSNFTEGGGFAGAVSQNTEFVRIVLVHKTKELTERPELNSTLNTKGQDVKLDQALTLEDYLIFQKKYFEETGKHLDETKYTWLATKSGARLVGSAWLAVKRELYVDARDLTDRDDSLGVRPARCFF
ncbi:MAG: hypothetical protein WCP24_02285 [bacterium]